VLSPALFAFGRCSRISSMADCLKANEKTISLGFYELITSNLKENAKKILNKLNKLYNNKITTKEFSPFSEFFDRRIEYYYEDKLILKLYENNSRCVVYRFSEKKKTHFGTNQLVFLYLLSNYHYKGFKSIKIYALR
jgi:hypothetical protein